MLIVNSWSLLLLVFILSLYAISFCTCLVVFCLFLFLSWFSFLFIFSFKLVINIFLCFHRAEWIIKWRFIFFSRKGIFVNPTTTRPNWKVAHAGFWKSKGEMRTKLKIRRGVSSDVRCSKTSIWRMNKGQHREPSG